MRAGVLEVAYTSRVMAFSMRTSVFALSLLAFAPLGCASSTPTVVKDPDYDFGRISSYAWLTDEPVLITFGDDHPGVRTEENETRLRAAIERELGARGIEKVDPERAQVLVAFSVGTRMRYRIEGGDRTSAFTDGPGEKQTKGTLNIYLLDHEAAMEVWHGSISKWLDRSEDPDVVVNRAVAKIMARFP